MESIEFFLFSDPESRVAIRLSRIIAVVAAEFSEVRTRIFVDLGMKGNNFIDVAAFYEDVMAEIRKHY